MVKYNELDGKYITDIFPEAEQQINYELNGLNELLLYPEPMVRLMSTIQAIMIELRKENFDWKTYRSLVLSAHKIVDEL